MDRLLVPSANTTCMTCPAQTKTNLSVLSAKVGVWVRAWAWRWCMVDCRLLHKVSALVAPAAAAGKHTRSNGTRMVVLPLTCRTTAPLINSL